MLSFYILAQTDSKEYVFVNIICMETRRYSNMQDVGFAVLIALSLCLTSSFPTTRVNLKIKRKEKVIQILSSTTNRTISLSKLQN